MENKKQLAMRLRPDIDQKVLKLQELKEFETGIKLTKTQIIEMLINEGLKKYEGCVNNGQ